MLREEFHLSKRPGWVRSARCDVRGAECGVRGEISGGFCVEQAASPLDVHRPLAPQQVEMSDHVEEGQEGLGIRQAGEKAFLRLHDRQLPLLEEIEQAGLAPLGVLADLAEPRVAV